MMMVMMIFIIIMMMSTRLKSIVFHDFIKKDADDDHQHFYEYLNPAHHNMHWVNKKDTGSRAIPGHEIFFFDWGK